MSSQVSPFAPLLKGNYVNLTTFRKSGVAVPTPMWFAEIDGIIYIYTGASSGKVKRIRNSGRVTLAPCSANGKVTGDAVEGSARIVSEQQEIARAEAALAKKYGVQRRLLYLFRDVTRTFGKRANDSAYLAIEA
jgi:uncharacterized protein